MVLFMIRLHLNKILGIFMIFVGIFILLFFINKIGFLEFLNNIEGIKLKYFLIAFVFAITSLLVVILRFNILLGKTGIGFVKVGKLYMQGVLMNYGSAIQGLGIGAKVVLIKMNNISVSRGSSVVTLEVLYDIIFCFFVSILFVFFLGSDLLKFIGKFIGSSIIIILVCFVVVIIIFLIIRRKIEFLKNYQKEITLHFRDKRKVIYCTMLTCLSWFSLTFMNYFFILSLDGSINIFFVFGGLTLGLVLGVATLIPGGLGVREGVYSYVYQLSGLPFSIGLTASVISRVIILILVIFLLVIIEIFKQKIELAD